MFYSYFKVLCYIVKTMQGNHYPEFYDLQLNSGHNIITDLMEDYNMDNYLF